jgi:hypothetical protein
MELMEVAVRLKKTKGSLLGVRARGKSGARVTQGRIPLLGRTSMQGRGLRVGPCISDGGGGALVGSNRPEGRHLFSSHTTNTSAGDRGTSEYCLDEWN